MIRIKDLQVGDCFSTTVADYRVEKIMPMPHLKKLDFIVTNLKSGRPDIHCSFGETEIMGSWQFIARQVPLSPNVQLELEVVREEMQKREKRGWEPDVVEPFMNIRDTLG